MPTMTMKVDMSGLMIEAAKTCKSFPIAMGFQAIENAMVSIAKHAVEKQDAFLLEKLEALGYITKS